ncbi:MAG TPA: aldehyde ferredoxin oxidoreductase N-terminal domain-containing protein [Desulfatiglandales bacterium]|nr:aldehyde ferredoxin oxidoreductase N-terminal domain-containing protein [Desulfatiglandales bacterium]
MGKIVHVNLSNLEVGHFPTQRYTDLYLGGRGIASRIYWETVAPEMGAFDPENRLIFMTGPMVATGVQGASRLSVVGKSPMALPEGYCYGSIGGFIGPELKRAGFDGVVIEGRAPKPMYLWIHDNKAKLRDASFLWGQGVYRTRELLEQAHGNTIRFLTTGVSGERRVRTAVLVASHDSTATAGFGAVMGSKNLKALVVKGTGRPSVADPDRLKELNRYTIHISKRFRLSTPPSLIGRQMVVECVGKGGCYQCGLECIRGRYRTPSGREGYRKCQSMEVYMPWQFSKDDEPVDTFFDAPTLCNDYSLCTMEIRSIVNWLYACYQSGCLTEEETGLPLSQIGTREFLEKLLHVIAYREGFGDILAEGLARAGGKLSDEARAMFTRDVVPIGMGDWLPPRAYITHALLYALEPRMHMPILHEVAHLCARWRAHLVQPDLSPVTSEVFRKVAKGFWGSEEAADLASYEGKALAAKKIQDRTYLKDSLGLCSFAWPITDSFNTPDHVGDPSLEAELFSAVTGISGEKLNQYAERIVNLQRAILIREGRRVPEFDSIPEYNFQEPLGTDILGRELIIPGPGDEAVSTVGNVLDWDRFKDMLKEYYQLRGWDQETGVPRAETLAALGLDDVASGFPVRENELVVQNEKQEPV